MDSNKEDNICFREARTQIDLALILRLQKANLPGSISVAESRDQGFVSVEHDIETLSMMNAPYPHIIAVDDKVLAGYCLVMLQEMREHIDLLKPMFEIIDKQSISGQSLRDLRYFVMGQVCVHKAYRGRGIFYKMYDHMRELMAGSFDMVITEISSHNSRSLRAHENQGFKTLHKFIDPVTAHPWEIVYWDWR